MLEKRVLEKARILRDSTKYSMTCDKIFQQSL